MKVKIYEDDKLMPRLSDIKISTIKTINDFNKLFGNN